jgi:hypothetical protein
MATGFRERLTSAPHIRLAHHGWLTPAAPGARRRCTEENDIRSAQSHVPKSGGHQPAVDVVTASATAFVHGRPARRRCAAIVVLPLQARYTNHGWLTPAAPDARPRCTEKNDIRGAQSHVPKSGGRQPAVDVVTASATAFVHGRPAGRRCAAIVVLPLQARYTNHGWLTPAAPDARRRCTEKATFAVHNRMFPRAAGVSPPWFAIRTLCRENQRITSRRCDPKTEAARIDPPCFRNRACGGDSAHNHGIRRVQSRAAGVNPPWMW